jgi:hypothetical protein
MCVEGPVEGNSRTTPVTGWRETLKALLVRRLVLTSLSAVEGAGAAKGAAETSGWDGVCEAAGCVAGGLTRLAMASGIGGAVDRVA